VPLGAIYCRRKAQSANADLAKQRASTTRMWRE
jgi:hypothetical protein